MSPDSDRITSLAWDPDDPQFLADPTEYYRWLRDEEPVHYHAASGCYFLSRFADVWEATDDWRTFSSQSAVSRFDHMASMDPPEHDLLRESVARTFSPRRIRALEPMVRTMCRELLEPLEARRSFDLVSEFASLLPSFVIHRLLGIPRVLDNGLREVALSIGAARDTATLSESMSQLERLTLRVVRGDPPCEEPGLLQELQASPRGARLGEAKLRGICSNLVLAGTDTVTNLLGNGVVLLARHRRAHEQLVADASCIPRAVEEMLRFESPVQSLARRVTRDVTLHGVTMPKGAELRLQWGAANRDEREFENADEFDIDRDIQRHLALGRGTHFCLGAALARLEARVALEEILARWPDFAVDEGNLERLPSLWVRGWERVVVIASAT